MLLKKRSLIVFVGCVTIWTFLLSIFLIGTNTREDAENNVLTRTTTRLHSLTQMSEFAFGNSIGNANKHSAAAASHYQQTILSFAHITQNPDNYRFKVEGGQDVLVFLHIQKTAGTSFERFLVRHLNVTHQCKCVFGEKRKMKCQCRRPVGRIWLFSRYSTGWACNLHADYTELIVSGCVNNKLDVREGKRHKRRLFLTTFLRDPIDRFVSEYTHVSERGATWARALHFCGGRLPTPEELPMCFDPDVGWCGVSLDEFLACPYNLAFNRQTRMLSDLSLVNCYNSSAMDAIVRDRIILESAKFNLRQFAFFGLKERMAESQFLFEKTLGLTFDADLSLWNKSKSAHVIPTRRQLDLIRQKNALDLVLYDFARSIFELRLSQIGRTTGLIVESSSSSSVKCHCDCVAKFHFLELP